MNSTPDEKSKKAIAKQVVAPNRKYFVPLPGLEVEADSVEEAVEAANDQEDTKDAQREG